MPIYAHRGRRVRKSRADEWAHAHAALESGHRDALLPLSDLYEEHGQQDTADALRQIHEMGWWPRRSDTVRGPRWATDPGSLPRELWVHLQGERIGTGRNVSWRWHPSVKDAILHLANAIRAHRRNPGLAKAKEPELAHLSRQGRPWRLSATGGAPSAGPVMPEVPMYYDNQFGRPYPTEVRDTIVQQALADGVPFEVALNRYHQRADQFRQYYRHRGRMGRLVRRYSRHLNV